MNPILLAFEALSVITFVAAITLMFRVRHLEDDVDQLHRAHHVDSDHMRSETLRAEWNDRAEELRRRIDQEMLARREYFTVWTREHEVKGHPHVN